MAKSNVKKVKRTVKMLAKGGLDREKLYRKKVKPVKHKMMDAEKKRVEKEISAEAAAEKQHMEDLRRLHEYDPEFKEYLQNEDPDFGDAVEDELVEDVEGEEAAAPAVDAEDDAAAELTEGECTKSFEALADTTQRNLKAIKRCVAYLKNAATVGYLGVGDTAPAKADDDDEDAAPTRSIRTTELFTYIVTEAVDGVPTALDAYLARSSKGGKPPHKCEGWDRVRGVARVFVTALADLLVSQGLPEDLLAHVLRSARAVLPYGFTHTAAMRALLKSCLHHVVHPNERVQLVAFVMVRDMAQPGALPPPFTDVCMKGMFLTFMKNTRTFSFESHATVSYVMNECVELFGVDLASAYQHIFMYVGKQAVYLSKALQSGAGEEAFRHVYNWQYVNSLRLWALTVAKYHSEKELYPLVYPIAQVACGVVELFPAPKTFPLHLIVLSVINHLSRQAGVYIPVAGYLLRILSSPQFAKHYKNQENKPVDLMFMLRAKKADMNSFAYQSAVFSEALYQLTDHLAMHSHTIGFPELAHPVVTRLKKLQKEVSAPKWRQQIVSLVQRIGSNADWIKARRKNVSYGPADVEKVAAWEAKAKDDGPPLMKSFRKDVERRDETRKMRLQALKGGARKTVDEMADDEETEESEENLADLAQAEDVDEESEEVADDAADDEDDGEEEEQTAPPPKKRHRRN